MDLKKEKNRGQYALRSREMPVATERDREKQGGGTYEFRDEMLVTCCYSLGLISVLMRCLSIASGSFCCSLPGEKKVLLWTIATLTRVYSL